MQKQWRFHPHDVGLVSDLERKAGVHSVVAQLLVSRGVYEAGEARFFLDAKLSGLRDPELLPGIPAAVDLLHAAIGDRRKIVIYGDYDADGITGTSILLLCLQMLNANVSYYIPSRLEDGYGLNTASLQRLAQHGAEVVVTVDCGIGSVAEAEAAAEAGLKLIITDHHEMGERLPPAAAIVHPRLPGASYPFGGLCGAGVALKLAWALCQRASDAKKVSPPMRHFLMTAVGLAAIGTVADVVPLADENRLLTRHGLLAIRNQPPLGLAELLKVTGLDEKSQLGAEDIAFTIGPRLNAAGRLGQAQLAVELLTTSNADRARSLAEYLHELNNSRDSLERSVLHAASKQLDERPHFLDAPALVLAGPGWHPGVIGLVASRLAEKHNLPTVVIAQDKDGLKPGAGSARSACGLKLHEAFAACSDRLLGHGGHAAAAGLTIADDQVESFREEFCEYVAGEIDPADRCQVIRIDAESTLSQLHIPVVRAIETLAPFGQGNPRPLLCATDVALAAPPQKMGNGERHLSLRIKQQGKTLRAVAFGKADWAEELEQLDGPFDIAFQPMINEYRGFQSVELRLIDWRPTRALTPKS